MKVIIPAYYEQFACIAGECEDTCCAGWEIDIDEKSYAYYQSLPGEYGEKVRGCIKEYQQDREDVYESHGFILKEGKRCPFLREDGLCEMILTLGEESLCDVCTDTPRNFLEYGGAREISLSPSCAEAGRLIFGNVEKTVFVIREMPGELEVMESEEERLFGERIRAVRDYGLQLLQERAHSVPERMAAFLCFGREVQQALNEEDMEGLEQLLSRAFSEYFVRAGERRKAQKEGSGEEYNSFQKRMAAYGCLLPINEEWKRYLQEMNRTFVEETQGQRNYTKAMTEYVSLIERETRTYEWEQLAVYLGFLMLSRCVDDWNFWGKVQFVAVSWLFVRDMDALRYAGTGRYAKEDRVDVMRIYAREVEHSQENLELLEEEFLFEEAYTIENLLRNVSHLWEQE